MGSAAISLAQHWLWLFPASYVLHITEEGLAGERFYRWLERIPIARGLGVRLGGRAFIVLNALYLMAMISIVLAAERRPLPWVAPALGFVVASNGFGHLAGSLMTRSYSPGTVSGLLLWAPLGLYALVRASASSAALWIGLLVAVLAYLVVLASAVGTARLVQQRPARS